MKTKSFFNMLLVMIIGFGACKDDDKKQEAQNVILSILGWAKLNTRKKD